MPSSSGPRWTIDWHMRWTASGSTTKPDPVPTMPAIPHIDLTTTTKSAASARRQSLRRRHSLPRSGCTCPEKLLPLLHLRHPRLTPAHCNGCVQHPQCIEPTAFKPSKRLLVSVLRLVLRRVPVKGIEDPDISIRVQRHRENVANQATDRASD